jgi:hypothetical protein
MTEEWGSRTLKTASLLLQGSVVADTFDKSVMSLDTLSQVVEAVELADEELIAAKALIEELEAIVAAKDVSIAVLKEACKEALWRLEQYGYQAMERTIERLRTVLAVKQESVE